MPVVLPDAILQKLTINLANPLRISPTDISQIVRLEQCERYLRFRLAEWAGQNFMKARPARFALRIDALGIDLQD